MSDSSKDLPVMGERTERRLPEPLASCIESGKHSEHVTERKEGDDIFWQADPCSRCGMTTPIFADKMRKL